MPMQTNKAINNPAQTVDIKPEIFFQEFIKL